MGVSERWGVKGKKNRSKKKKKGKVGTHWGGVQNNLWVEDYQLERWERPIPRGGGLEKKNGDSVKGSRKKNTIHCTG